MRQNCSSCSFANDDESNPRSSGNGFTGISITRSSSYHDSSLSSSDAYAHFTGCEHRCLWCHFLTLTQLHRRFNPTDSIRNEWRCAYGEEGLQALLQR